MIQEERKEEEEDDEEKKGKKKKERKERTMKNVQAADPLLFSTLMLITELICLRFLLARREAT